MQRTTLFNQFQCTRYVLRLSAFNVTVT